MSQLVAHSKNAGQKALLYDASGNPIYSTGSALWTQGYVLGSGDNLLPTRFGNLWGNAQLNSPTAAVLAAAPGSGQYIYVKAFHIMIPANQSSAYNIYLAEGGGGFMFWSIPSGLSSPIIINSPDGFYYHFKNANAALEVTFSGTGVSGYICVNVNYGITSLLV